MTSDKKIKFIKEALDDLKIGKLNEFSALIAISIIVFDDKEHSEEFKEWAENAIISLQ